MAVDLVTVVNLVLAMTICAVGLWNYGRTRNTMSFYVGVGFFFFAMSHIITLAGIATEMWVPVMVARIAGYLLALFGLVYRGNAGAAAQQQGKKK
jgi:hypothetical protein